MTEAVEHLHVLVGHLYFFFGEIPTQVLFLFLFLKKLINLFIFGCVGSLLMGLRCCVQAFSSCGERGLLLVVVRGLLIVVASLVSELGL